MRYIFAILLGMIAFGTIWTAYESHIANIGVMAWQQQFSEIRGEGGNDMRQPPDHPKEPPIKSF